MPVATAIASCVAVEASSIARATTAAPATHASSVTQAAASSSSCAVAVASPCAAAAASLGLAPHASLVTAATAPTDVVRMVVRQPRRRVGAKVLLACRDVQLMLSMRGDERQPAASGTRAATTPSVASPFSTASLAIPSTAFLATLPFAARHNP